MLFNFSIADSNSMIDLFDFSMLHDRMVECGGVSCFHNSKLIDVLNVSTIYGENKVEFLKALEKARDIVQMGKVTNSDLCGLKVSFLLLLGTRVFAYGFTLDKDMLGFTGEHLIEMLGDSRQKVIYYIDTLSREFDSDVGVAIDSAKFDYLYKRLYLHTIKGHDSIAQLHTIKGHDSIAQDIYDWFTKSLCILNLDEKDVECEKAYSMLRLAPVPTLIDRCSDFGSTVFMYFSTDRDAMGRDIFYESVSNWMTKHRGSSNQLILLPYYTNLLDLNLMPRESIWFTSPTEDSFRLTSLYDFTTSFDDILERAYLDGRYTGTRYHVTEEH